MKGYRTIIFHVVAILTPLAGIALQYLDLLGLDDRSAFFAILALTAAQSVGGIILRIKTDTAVGQGS